jgi:hypothetical protein
MISQWRRTKEFTFATPPEAGREKCGVCWAGRVDPCFLHLRVPAANAANKSVNRSGYISGDSTRKLLETFSVIRAFS